MPDEYIERETIGFGKNIGSSIKGFFVGIIFFIAGVIILWINEGRVNIGKVAEKLSIPISAEKLDNSYNGKFISATGVFKSTGELGDPGFLKSGPYAVLHRNVEMYAWVEQKSTKTRKKIGGKTEKITTYKYKKRWTSKPPESSSFRHPEDHKNPQLMIPPATFYALTANIGKYKIDIRSVKLPALRTLSLSKEMLEDGAHGRVEGSYIFNGVGSIYEPEVGDIRIYYTVLPATFSPATVFGKVEGNSIAPFFYKGKKKIYRLFIGTREEAIARMKTEHNIIGWLLRILGFLLIWGGFNGLFGPIFAVLDILPFLGNITRLLVSFITFIIALILSIAIILVSMIAHNILALIITVVLIVAIFIFVFHRKKEKVIRNSAI